MLCLLVSSVFLVLTLWDAYGPVRLRLWGAETEGRVVRHKSSIREHLLRRRGPDDPQHALGDIKKVELVAVAVLQARDGSREFEVVAEPASAYPVGSMHKVLFTPGRPGTAQTKVTVMAWRPPIPYLVGVVLPLGVVVGIIIVRRRRGR